MPETLEQRIARLQQSTETFKYETEKKRKTSSAGRLSKDVTSFQKFFFQVVSAFIWIFKRGVEPFIRWSYGPLSYILTLYIRFWTKCVYIKDEYNIPIFSQVRAGLTVLGTVGFLYFLAIPLLSFLADSAIYATTAQVDEKIYLNGSQQLDNEGTHAVEGCSILPCSDSDSLYFRTNTSVFNDVWSIVHRGHLFYPDQVASGIPYDISECTITSYGIRNRWLNHTGLSYPSLLGYKSCQPIADGRKNQRKENHNE